VRQILKSRMINPDVYDVWMMRTSDNNHCVLLDDAAMHAERIVCNILGIHVNELGRGKDRS